MKELRILFVFDSFVIVFFVRLDLGDFVGEWIRKVNLSRVLVFAFEGDFKVQMERSVAVPPWINSLKFRPSVRIRNLNPSQEGRLLCRFRVRSRDLFGI